MDAAIYAIVLHPALHDLLHSASGPPTTEQIGWYGGIIFSIFLIGWAIGGITFGILADRFGRTKVLITTIIIYAVFTGAAALSETWWHLAIYRFLTALGIGGEWAAVAETWPEEKRAKAAEVLQSAWAVEGYLPKLFPTRLCATGAGFCFNAGRILASASPFLTGWLVTTLGTFGRAASTVALIYLAGLVVLLFAPETKGKPLPD